MKNVTITLREPLIREARRIAAERGTTLNAMIRGYLTEVVERDSHIVEARKRIVHLCNRTDAEVGERAWTRDQIHER